MELTKATSIPKGFTRILARATPLSQSRGEWHQVAVAILTTFRRKYSYCHKRIKSFHQWWKQVTHDGQKYTFPLSWTKVDNIFRQLSRWTS